MSVGKSADVSTSEEHRKSSLPMTSSSKTFCSLHSYSSSSVFSKSFSCWLKIFLSEFLEAVVSTISFITVYFPSCPEAVDRAMAATKKGWQTPPQARPWILCYYDVPLGGVVCYDLCRWWANYGPPSAFRWLPRACIKQKQLSQHSRFLIA